MNFKSFEALTASSNFNYLMLGILKYSSIISSSLLTFLAFVKQTLTKEAVY